MDDLLKLLRKQRVQQEQKYRNVRIHPKVLETQKSFTPEEKEQLTKKGLYWYIYYDFKNPVTGKFERQSAIKNRINQRFPDFDQRLKEIKLTKIALKELLEEGWSPYLEPDNSDSYSAISCLDYALDLKKNQVGNRTFETYKNHLKQFKNWLTANHYDNKPITAIDKKLINKFLNHVTRSNSNRTANNFKSSLSAIFTILAKDDYIADNFILKIDNLKTATKRDPTWSEKHVSDTDKYLAENDKTLFMFIRFVDYMFWRPKENCRLKVKDVNLEQRLISTRTKTKGAKTKLIPGILVEDLSDYLKGASSEDYLFTPDGPGAWDRDLDGRRSYFTLKFRRVRNKLKLPKNYTIYGRRHTGVTKVYRNLRQKHEKETALDILAQITGHTSRAAMAEYIHYIDAELLDHSQYL